LLQKLEQCSEALITFEEKLQQQAHETLMWKEKYEEECKKKPNSSTNPTLKVPPRRSSTMESLAEFATKNKVFYCLIDPF
jgi:hypothetical protein